MCRGAWEERTWPPHARASLRCGAEATVGPTRPQRLTKSRGSRPAREGGPSRLPRSGRRGRRLGSLRVHRHRPTLQSSVHAATRRELDEGILGRAVALSHNSDDLAKLAEGSDQVHLFGRPRHIPNPQSVACSGSSFGCPYNCSSDCFSGPLHCGRLLPLGQQLTPLPLLLLLPPLPVPHCHPARPDAQLVHCHVPDMNPRIARSCTGRTDVYTAVRRSLIEKSEHLQI